MESLFVGVLRYHLSGYINDFIPRAYLLDKTCDADTRLSKEIVYRHNGGYYMFAIFGGINEKKKRLEAGSPERFASLIKSAYKEGQIFLIKFNDKNWMEPISIDTLDPILSVF